MAQPTGTKTAAEGAAQAADGAAQAARGAAQAAADAERVEVLARVHEPLLRPIVYEVRSDRKGGRKKKKYSRGLKAPQQAAEGSVRAAERLAQAAADGLSKFRKRSNNSSRKRRDGALRDGLRNLGRAMEETMTTAAKAPTDFTRRVSVRRLTRVMVPPFPWPMR